MLRIDNWRTIKWRAKKWWTEPFRTYTYYHDTTRLEFRAFPFKLRAQAVESIHEKVRRGGLVCVPDGVHLVTKPIEITEDGTSLVGMTFVSKGTSPNFSILEWKPTC